MTQNGSNLGASPINAPKKLHWKYPFPYGLTIVTSFHRLHERALDIFYSCYGGSDRSTAVLFCTNQKRWAKLKVSVEIIERHLEKRIPEIKWILKKYFTEGFHEEQRTTNKQSDYDRVRNKERRDFKRALRDRHR